MNLPLIVALSAKNDVVEISRWYDSQTPQTGERFLIALDRKFERVCEHPLIYRALRNSEIRRCKLEHWPYHVFFTCTGTSIEIIAIIHTSRDPEYISQRTSS